ncbi:MAG TPA: hypothetical protein VFG59_11385, partial [Anaeromyxobacter sp.]|nr:hypothetical protein [Anaeromyxobacter sp.]
YDPNAAAYDLNAPYDPNAAAYDPTAPYDPNAAAYDPNAPYDPNAAAYDPNAPYDPNAAAPDANADFSPGEQPFAEAGAASFESIDAGLEPMPGSHDDSDWSGVAAGFDAPAEEVRLAEGDPDVEGVALEGSEPLLASTEAPAPLPGEGEEPAWAPLPGGDYDAAAWDAVPPPPPEETSQPISGAPAGVDLEPYPSAAWSGEPELSPPHTPALGFGSYDDASPPASTPEDLEALLPFDPAAASAVGPDALRALGGPPSDLEPIEIGRPDAAAAEPGGFFASSSLGEEGWQPEPGAVDQGFQLESGGSFDARADAAAPEWAAPPGPFPWETPAVDETASPPPPAPEMNLEGTEPELPPAPEMNLEGIEPELDLGGSVPGAVTPPLEPESAWQPLAEAEPSPAFEPSVGPLDVGETPAPAHAETASREEVSDEIPTLEAEDVIEEVLPEAIEVVDEVPEEAAVAPGSGPEPAPVYAETTEPAATSPVDTPPAPETPAEPAAEPAPTTAVFSPEPPSPGPESPPADAVIEATEAELDLGQPEPASEFLISGSHRVVVHTLEGQVKRGFLQDADLSASSLPLAPTPGGTPEDLPTDHVKAVFFMLAPGEQPRPPHGSKVRVTFRDGRQVAGFSPDYREETIGFFMIPADSRTSTGQIWVYRSAVKQVAVS